MLNFIQEMYVKMITLKHNEKGQTLVEYALLLVLIASVVIVILKAVGGQTSNAFSTVNSALTPAGS